MDWFHRYGPYAVFFGRLVPTVRTLISVPAGLSEMRFPTFLAYTGTGFEPFAGSGFLLVNGTFTEVGGIFGITPVPEPTGIALLLPLWLVLRRRR